MKCLEHNNRAVILATVTPLTFLILSIFFFDIPLATWIDSYWMVRFPVIGKPDIPDILLITVVILTILSWTGYLYLSRLNIYDQRTFACRVMGTILPISYGVKIILKWVFGRTDVRTWLADPSLHGFHWFAGTEDAPRNDTQAHDVAPTGHSDTMTAASPASGVIPPTSLPERHDIPAAPSVRLLARELGIDLAQVPGSGLGGRISNGDVKAYCKMLNTSRGTGVASQPLPDFTKWGSVHREAMNNVRKKTAERLSHAWQNIPYVTQFDKADITQLEKLRKSISGTKTATPKKISVTPFIIKAVAAGLKKFPQFNSSIDITTQEIIFKDYINIGLAIDTDRGLLVPVLKNVDKMSLLQISDELAAMAQRARLRKITIEELQGGCFTISNLGGIGGTSFTPIINWPEVAILGVSRTLTEPVYIDGQFMPRPMLPLSLSYDHRVIDGADAARFVRWICEALQRWKDE